MPCDSLNKCSFALYEIDLNGKRIDTNKTFDVELVASNKLLSVAGLGIDRYINRQGIILTMFNSIYGFNSGTRGFCLKWIDKNNMRDAFISDPDALAKKFGAIIYWASDTWQLKRV